MIFNKSEIPEDLKKYFIPAELGLELTPEEYVEKLVEVFHEVRRVLRDDAVLWVNIGDSYAASGGSGSAEYSQRHKQFGKVINQGTRVPSRKTTGLKPKDLVGIPWMLAFALRADGWWLRQDIIWAKGSSGYYSGGSVMPESVTDRCTKAHEYVFLLSKSKDYYYNQDAIRDPYIEPMNRWGGQDLEAKGKSTWDEGTGQNTYRDRDMRPNKNGRNRRSVWMIATEHFAETHFATYPTELVRVCLLAGCPPNGIVLDPFFGSGTTGVVAKKLMMNYIGIDLNPEYVAIAEKRIATIDSDVVRYKSIDFF